jgi:diguanylate cyclase (GGDEF)-like protein
MSVNTIFHISIEFWGAVLCVIAFFCVVADKETRRVQRYVKIGMQLCCMVLMISDSLYMGLRGNPADWVYYIVRVSKYLVFFSNYIYMMLIVVYLWQLICDEGEPMPKRLYIVDALSIFSILMITISLFNGMIYYFDEGNMYHRSTFYALIQLAVVGQIIVIFTVYIQYRKRLSRFVSGAIIAYFVLSTVTTLLVVLKTPFSLQNLAVVVATLIMFAVDYFDMSSKLGKSRAAYSKANYAAQHDSMTDIYNKEWGMAHITEFIEGMEDGDKASLCFIDIDDFKHINDRYGHMTGDYWIKEIATLLRKTCRRDDVICRFGGDEYLLLLKGVDDAEVLKSRVFQLNEHLKVRSVERGQDVHVSIGACTITGGGHEVKQVIKLADAALYEGKRGGKNTCVIYHMEADAQKQPGRQQLNIKESFDIQNRVYHKFMDVFASVVFIRLDDGEYEVLKDSLGLEKNVAIDGNYETRARALAEALTIGENRDKILEFMSTERIRAQKDTAGTLAFTDVNGRRCLIHTLIDDGQFSDETIVKATDGHGGNHACVVALQVM